MRTRFAPSPTGYLHIGSLRTALFVYLAAKSMDGKFILRIEDTDQSREVSGAVENLIKILDWIGINFDEGPHIDGGFGPYTQSQRVEIYNKYIQELLDKDEAYHCFCTPERLDSMRKEQQEKKQAPRYDRICRNLSKEEVLGRLSGGERYVIRQKMPLDGEIVVHDELRGDITFKCADMEDHVLIKSNGIPTYQFANVVDDHLMEITHVLRGDEWIASFPKNILLYKSFGWEAPKFAHLSLILNKEGGKLSKRQGDVAVEDYRAKGYLPESLLNFCVLMGWHPKDDNEILSLADMQEKFRIEDIGISPAVFDVEKLDYFNGYYIRQKPLEELVALCKPYLAENISKTSEERKKRDDFLKKVVALEQERMKKLSDIKEGTEFFFSEIEYESELLIWKKLTKEEVKNNLEKMAELLNEIQEGNWIKTSIEERVMAYLKAKDLKVGDYLWPMRVSLTGRKASPGPFEIADVLGKKESLERMKNAINKL
ncbi:MAG: glutamate--tRNA ligase [Patescibacteria group bacterium]